MRFFIPVITLLASVSATAVPKRDWKYAFGWDGKVEEYESWQITPIGDRLPAGHKAPEGLEKRTAGCVYVCMDVNFATQCQYICTPLNTCFEVGSCKANTISSFGPDPGATCYAYRTNTCTGSTWTFTYPGGGDGGLSWNNGNAWNDAINSWTCV